MPSLVASGVTFAWSDAVPLFADVHLPLHPGFTGLVGPNGAGKSTLLAILAGDLAPTAGRVRREPADGVVRVCPQAVDAPPEDLEALAWSADRGDQRILARLHLDPGSIERWPTLSPGERKRWQVACALSAAPDLLLLDEPTNHLDGQGRAWLVDALLAFRGVGVLVSHDRALLDALCHTTLRLRPSEGGRPGDVEVWPGRYSAARAAWEAAAEERRATHTRLQAEERAVRGRLGDARRTHASIEADRSAGARMKGPRDSDARGVMAQGRVDRAGAKSGREVQVLRAEHERRRGALEASRWEGEVGRALFLAFEPAPQPWVLRLETPGLSRGDRALTGPLSLAVGRADRIRVAGPNGSGKTTLLDALLAQSALPPERLLVLPQELPTGQGRAWLDAARALPSDRRGAVMQLVAALGVAPSRLLASAEPSPGEARKLGIALALAQEAWVAVLDEPTNHLDLPSVERLQAALAAWPGALVLVTHDDTFAAACTRTTWSLPALAGDTRGSSV